jgi:hypothetical protein
LDEGSKRNENICFKYLERAFTFTIEQTTIKMDAAIITNSKLQADLNLQSTLIRTAVIISNNCWLSPSDIGLISHNDFFLSKFVGLKEKLYQLSIQAKRMDMSAYPDFVDAIDKLPAILKTLNSIKHPPPNIVKEKKKLEAWINSVYEDIVRQRSNVFSSSGLLQISEIIDKDYIYFLDKNDEGNYSNVDFVNHSVKDVMQLNFHETKGRPLKRRVWRCSTCFSSLLFIERRGGKR